MYTSWDRKCHFQGHVTLTYKVTRQGHDIRLYSIDFPELNNLRNKTNYRSSLYTSWNRKCHFQGHVTLTYKVTRQGHDIRLYSIDFPEMNNLRNKKKLNVPACILVKLLLHFTFFRISKIMTSFKVTAWRQLSDNVKNYNAVFRLCHSSRNTWNFAWISLSVIKLSMIIYPWGLKRPHHTS